MMLSHLRAQQILERQLILRDREQLAFQHAFPIQTTGFKAHTRSPSFIQLPSSKSIVALPSSHTHTHTQASQVTKPGIIPQAGTC